MPSSPPGRAEGQHGPPPANAIESHRTAGHSLARAVILTSVLLAGMGCEDISVNVIPAVGLQLSPASVSVMEGEELPLSATPVGPAGEALAGRTVVWSSDDTSVASVTTAGLLRGESPGVVTVRARVDDLEATAPVTVVRGPTIGLPGTTIQWTGFAGQASPLVEEFALVNDGAGTLAGLEVQVSHEGPETVEWLTASLGSGSAPTTLQVQAALSTLTPGTYRGTVSVGSAVARNSPRILDVVVTVLEPLPAVGIGATSVSFTSPPGAREPASQSVPVVNMGGGILEPLVVSVTYLTGDGGWLSARLEDSMAPTELTLEASALMLGPGTYRAEVEVSSTSAPGGSATLEVEFNVLLPPPSSPQRDP